MLMSRHLYDSTIPIVSDKINWIYILMCDLNNTVHSLNEMKQRSCSFMQNKDTFNLINWLRITNFRRSWTKLSKWNRYYVNILKPLLFLVHTFALSVKYICSEKYRRQFVTMGTLICNNPWVLRAGPWQYPAGRSPKD